MHWRDEDSTNSSGDIAEPVFCKARPIPYGLWPAVHNCIKDLVSQGIRSQVKTSKWATPIVTPLKADSDLEYVVIIASVNRHLSMTIVLQ